MQSETATRFIWCDLRWISLTGLRMVRIRRGVAVWLVGGWWLSKIAVEKETAAAPGRRAHGCFAHEAMMGQVLIGRWFTISRCQAQWHDRKSGRIQTRTISTDRHRRCSSLHPRSIVKTGTHRCETLHLRTAKAFDAYAFGDLHACFKKRAPHGALVSTRTEICHAVMS
jgi:hypothetical protein